MFQNNRKFFFDENMEIVFHKSPLVEAVASLHSLKSDVQGNNKSENRVKESIRKINPDLRHRLDVFGELYANWLLIMDLATFISVNYYTKTGKTTITFENAMKEYRNIDDVTFLYVFLGMPALGLSKGDAQDFIDNPNNLNKRAVKLIGQYIFKENIKEFIKNINGVKDELAELITGYWNCVFHHIWNDIQGLIDRTTKTCMFECSNARDCTTYLASLHNDIYVTKEQLFLKKDITYMIPLNEIRTTHIFPSVFSGNELLVDRFYDNLIIYYNSNLKAVATAYDVPRELSMLFKALSDDNRIKITKILMGSPSTTQHIANVLGLAESTVSVHLKKLKSAGILRSKAVKKHVYYETNYEKLDSIGVELKDYIEKK